MRHSIYILVLLAGCAGMLNPGAEAKAPAPVDFPEAEALLPAAAKTYAAQAEGALDIKASYVIGRIWTYERDVYGRNVIARGTATMLFVHNKPYSMCHYVVANLWQQDRGGGQWGAPYLKVVDTGENTKLTCDSVERIARAGR